MKKMSDKIIKKIKDSEIVIFDVDNTIVDGRMANSALYLIDEEKERRNIKNYVIGIFGGLEVMIGTKLISKLHPENEIRAENWGLNKTLKILGKAGIKKERIQKAAEKYYEKHKIEGIEDLVETFKDDYGLHIWISSSGADIFLEPVVKKLGAIGFTSNMTGYSDEIPKKLFPRIRTPEERLKQTHNDIIYHVGYSLPKSIYIDDSITGLPFKDLVNVFISSPLAQPEVRRVADIELNKENGYLWLNEQLKYSS
ncbi:MAG: HAD family hydrolase [Candidatus Aenigmarchaeota archaeon]|nr:HAD family hydrolase [Candidatus Aenigmarchaeota archaeon]